MADAPRIHVVHATAPGCHWSWGYEAVLERLRLVYGDQISIHLVVSCPYDDWDQWLRDYEMTFDEALDWLAETGETMGTPIARLTRETVPRTVLPASLAALAALRQGDKPGWRYHRALLRRYAVEGRDISQRDVIEEAAAEAGLDLARFRRDLADDEGLRAQMAEQGKDAPPMHVGFYNLGVTDGERRRVMLDYAFEPRMAEEAIDYLSGGTLVKRAPTDVVGYLREHGWAPLVEVARVFALDDDEARRRLEAHEKAGHVERTTLAGAPHWRATVVER